MQFSSTQQQALAWFAITLVLALVLWLLGPVLMPFVVASVLAYALDPVVTRLQLLTRGRMPRVVAVLFCLHAPACCRLPTDDDAAEHHLSCSRTS